MYSFESAQLKKDIPDLKPGQTVRVHQKVHEGDKVRTQVFEGVIIAMRGSRPLTRTMTVRKIASGVGVERIFPLHSPLITKIEVAKSAQVRRAKLHYLRNPRARQLKETAAK